MLSFNKVNIISLLSIGVLGFLKSENLISFLWIVLVVLIWLILTIIGSFHIRWNYFLKANHRNDQIKENVIALTFDDGPNEIFTPKVLALLNKYQVKATFFCIGENVKNNQELLKKIVREGHLLGNHSYDHKNSFSFFSTDKVIENLEETNRIIEETVNLEVLFFRPPFGVTNPNIARAVKRLKLQTFGWSIRSLDTIAKDPEKVYHKIIKKLKKGDVVLLHDTSELSIQVLEKVLQYLDQKEIKSITLDKLFNLKAYA